MGYELNRLMKQYGVATPTMAAAPQMPGAAPVESAYTDAAKYAADKAAFDENVRKYGLAQKEYDQYKADYQNRLANTNMYNQAQYSTTGANVPAITTFSDAQKYAIGALPAAKTPVGAQQFAGVDQSGLNRRIQEYMANTKPSPTQLEEAKRIYGVNDYDIRNAMGTGTQYGTPQWADTVRAPSYGVAPISLAGAPLQDKLDFYTRQRGIGYTDADLRAGAEKTFGKLPDQEWKHLVTQAGFPETDIVNTPYVATYNPYATNTNTNTDNTDYTDYTKPVLYEEEFQTGGAVKGYQAGGITDPETGVITYPVPPRLPLQRREIGAVDVVAPEPVIETSAIQPAVAPSSRLSELERMLSQYGPQNIDYSGQITSARETQRAEQKAFEDMLKAQLASPEDAASSKAELYFRLASAFGSPSKTGHFTENLSLAGKEMADNAAAQRAERAKKLGVQLELQKMKMESANNEVDTLRALEAESMKDRRAIAQEMIKDYIASGKPQSEAGRIALDMGLQRGTPEYEAKVNELTILEVQKQTAAINAQLASIAAAARRGEQMSPTEMNLLVQTEETLGGLDQAMRDLSRAYSLNQNSYSGAWLDRGQRWLYEGAGSSDPKILNTREIDNLLGGQALEKLKATFGGSGITNSEREELMKLQGIGAMSLEERSRTMLRSYEVIQNIITRLSQRQADIKSGRYRTYDPTVGAQQ